MKTNFPRKMDLANLPTKIEELSSTSNLFKNINVYIKRDDQTGFELSGNKVRKLEYVMQDVISNEYDHVITCGGVQSNHVRSTAACAAKLGLKCVAVLKGAKPETLTSNVYMDEMFGAEIIYISEDDYKYKRADIMNDIKLKLETDNHKAYVIPEGASDALGNLGYFDAYSEILEQEKELGINFDILSVAVGSCSTYCGLLLGDKFNNNNKNIIGINIYDAKADFGKKSFDLAISSSHYFTEELDITESDITIVSDYVGEGYGITQPEVFSLIKEFASTEGILVDRVYTGKGLYGFLEELKKIDAQMSLDNSEKVNALFIHTGGAFVF